MYSKGALAGCSVWVVGVAGFFCRAVRVVANVRFADSEGAAALDAKVRANEQLGQAMVMCVAILLRKTAVDLKSAMRWSRGSGVRIRIWLFAASSIKSHPSMLFNGPLID